VAKYFLIPLSMALVLGAWVAAGLLMSGSYIAADACVDPRVVSGGSAVNARACFQVACERLIELVDVARVWCVYLNAPEFPCHGAATHVHLYAHTREPRYCACSHQLHTPATPFPAARSYQPRSTATPHLPCATT
jgi:hypothetical protein